ncbi:TIGR03564 family F420-dependent LLM class oxidoreductase [Yinghuangia sp. ASG 101]|uniref:TIGR03564 family F420-dependent LLM class oxidoreductase n=1 Tax=Yinghuangia sp. ASG 101 TaxID=2896848 RepID=UPI001E5D0E12|nr:TIGR03564 family F420-dependent LLM class oxidoreductase [Yinghuangia sp. ASG 101]UGQ13523.1 TIGR03564 family F420-dependent LLM class oxidoreductase [Yinghuangia sp. ASG 101]
MRVGIYLNTQQAALDGLVERAAAAEQAGLASAFVSQLTGWDAAALAALVGSRVGRIEVGTAVIPTYPRHPLTLAGQAMTTQAAIGGRFTLGIGPGHRPLVEGQFGVSGDALAAHTREYLGVLRSLLRGEPVEHRGPTLTAVGQVDVPGASEPGVLVSALGPRMLRVAGELADGTVTVWTVPDAVDKHIRPILDDAAAEAGRPRPRIVAGVLVGVTADPDTLCESIDERFHAATELPNYHAHLQRQGLSRMSETAIVGDEEHVARQLRRYAEAGVTDLLASSIGDVETRTWDVLAAAHADD